MKRKFLMFLALAVCISMTACGDAKNDDSKAEKTTDTTSVTTTAASEEAAESESEAEEIPETELGPKLVTLTFPDGKTMDINVGTNVKKLVEEAGLKPVITSRGYYTNNGTSVDFFGFIPDDGTDDNNLKNNETALFLVYKDKDRKYVDVSKNEIPSDWTICGVKVERFHEDHFDGENLITYSPDSIAVDYDGIELGKTDYYDILEREYEQPFSVYSPVWKDNDVCFTTSYKDESLFFETDPEDTTIDEFTIISADCIDIFDCYNY
ncbi:MAG: hypothetical protein J5582_08370 [Ruminococcus sp.]|uniref:hypothetical protein n=1 Tax=Ruminococcus sp. TaxID=41978 RepID=UPI0025E1C299|nr:hypothetical protein [Ruminococcus sp.]MBO4866572.1 hypothetical protein [Ruminococcus sp.]